MMIQEDRRGGRRSGRRGRLVSVAVLLVLCAALSIQALAGDGYVDLTGDLSYFSLGEYLELSYAYEDESDYGNGAAYITIADNEITMQAGDATSGSGLRKKYKATTVTLYLTNNSPSTVTIQFDYTVTNSGSLGNLGEEGTSYSCEESSSSGTTTGTATLVIESGYTGSLYVKSTGDNDGDAYATITISSITSDVFPTYITFVEAEHGSYSVSCTDGTTVTVGTEHESNSGESYTVSAPEADDGYVFYRWEDGDGNVLSYDESCSGITGNSASGSKTVTAVFRNEDSAVFYIEGEEDTWYYYLDEAIEAAEASSSMEIVMYGTDSTSSPTAGTVYGSDGQTDFTIPSGVTLLLPYDQDDLDLGGSYGDDDDYSNTTFTSVYGTSGWSGSLEVDTSAVLELTVPSGTSITVYGTLAVGGTVNAQANTASGATRGAHANLVLNEGSSLVIGSGGVLSACGYVYGAGSVSCESGSELYQPLVVLDFLGGGYTVGAAGYTYTAGRILGYYMDTVSGEDYVMPFNRYAAQNIQTDLDMVYGAVMYAYADLYANDDDQTSMGVLVGNSSNKGIITLSSDASIHFEYDAETAVSGYSQIGRVSMTIRGGASFGSLDLSIKYKEYGITLYSVTVETSDFIFPIPYNFDISLEDGSYEIDNSMAILPGATLTVEEDATLNVDADTFLVYDGLDEYSCTSSSTSYSSSHAGSTSNNDYPTTSQLQTAGLSRCGELIVNGTLNIGTGGSSMTFAGLVQTEAGSGAEISVGESVSTSYTAQVGQTGSYDFLTSSYSFSGATVYDLTALIVSAFTGEETSMVAGTTYYGVSGKYTDESYTYTLYSNSSYTDPNADGASSYIVTYTDETEQSIIGAWYSTAVPVYEVGTFTGLASEAAETLYFAAGDSLAKLVEAYSGTGLYTSYEDSTLSGAVESTATIDDLEEITAFYTASPEFAIRYDSNGGSGTMETQYYTLADATAVALTENTFTSVQGSFQGWALSSGAEEATLADGWSGTAAALESALQAEDSTFALSDGLTITLYAVWGSEEVISVTVVWGEMDYTYESDSEYVWDGSTLMYTLVEDEDAGWTSDSSTIQIINGSESSPVSVSIAYENTDLGSSFGLLMSFADQSSLGSIFSSETSSASISSLPAGATAVINAGLSGTPSGSGTGVELGTVTVTITGTSG